MTLDKRKLKKVAAEALEELYAAALTEEGLTIYGISGYRSFDRQYDIYGANLITKGTRHTNLYSAAPGNSEHQTGLAIDVSCQSIGFALVERFENTPEGIWLKDNCWRFGFILRYPKDKERITGYAYEPWHIRYVGVPLAYYLYTNNLTLEEYYGSPSSHTLEELKDRPLIDMHTERFYKLYAATLGSELIYQSDGSILLSKSTGFPHLKEFIRDAAGSVIKVNGKAFAVEPILDANGNYILDADNNICYTKPYFDIEGSLWLDYNGVPVFLQPLWNADGTLAYDAFGNLLYTEPELDLTGLEKITETGSLIQKVPIRDEKGELTFHPDGSVCFYEPFVNPISGEYILDSSTGLPLYPLEYYEVPHNTLPLPEEYLLNRTEPQEPEDPNYDTNEETGGFFG
ncbi:MAG: M15 family metallopeptidase [Lachnospiraceae bacterium]|nr:M15 family metallopeptidase [Lachnospiraceae bacterium]